MLKKYWCPIVLILLIVAGAAFAYRWYKFYDYSPIAGHTETQSGASSDDYDHCFNQTDSNTVVLIAHIPLVKKESVTLVDLNAMGNIQSPYPILGTVISNQPPENPQDLGNGRIRIAFHDFKSHLGPGPYMVVVTAPGTDKGSTSASEGNKLFYYYQTYNKADGHGPEQCAAYRDK